jgi:hypothetical protein
MQAGTMYALAAAIHFAGSAIAASWKKIIQTVAIDFGFSRSFTTVDYCLKITVPSQ